MKELECSICGEKLDEYANVIMCDSCNKIACVTCHCNWDECDYCGATYCEDCDPLDFSEVLNKTFCEDCEIDAKTEEEDYMESELKAESRRLEHSLNIEKENEE